MLKRKQNMKRNGFVLASLVLTRVWVIELITWLCVCLCVWESAAMPFSREIHTKSHRWLRSQSKPKEGTRNCPWWMQMSGCLCVCLFSRVFVPFPIFLLCLIEAFVLSDKSCSGVCVWVLWLNQYLAVYISPKHTLLPGVINILYLLLSPSFLLPTSIHPSPPTNPPFLRRIKSPQLKNKYATLKHKIWNWFILCLK